MCGIVGAVSTRNIVPILVEGLKRLEYRGYDSCGVAVHQDGGLRRARNLAEHALAAKTRQPTAIDAARRGSESAVDEERRGMRGLLPGSDDGLAV